MKKLIYPIQLNEASYSVQLLHSALAALDLPVAETERLEKKAGDSTLKSVRELQKKLGVQFDNTVLIDSATATAIERELKTRGIMEDNCTFTATGKVISTSGNYVARQKLVAFDIDLKAAGIYRKIQNLDEVKKNSGFEFLGETSSDKDGNYSITFSCGQFKSAERKKADIVVYALRQNDIIGSSRLVNAEDYSDKGEVRNLDVIISKTDNRNEYETLMNALNPFLEESGVFLYELSASKEQINFTAGELSAPPERISIAASAQKLITDNKLKISHELLYGLGKQGYTLNLKNFVNKKPDELKNAVNTSVSQNIIKSHKDEEIDSFINSLLAASSETALVYKNEKINVTLGEVLSNALPNKKQQTAFLDSVRTFTGTNYKDFWSKHLPSNPEFKDNPELIKGLLFTHQLTLITANHQPLVSELQKKYKQNDAAELLKISNDEWNRILKKTGVPGGVPGKDNNEKIKNYASHVQNVLNAAYPTQKINLMIQNKDITIEDSAVAGGVQKFLSGDIKFDFAKSRVHDFEDEIKKAFSKNPEGLKSELMKIQRIFQVSPTPEAMSALIKGGLDSAHAIAGIPRKSFIKMYSKELGGDAVAFSVHEKATYMTARSEMAAMKMMEVSHSLTPSFAMGNAEYDIAYEALQNAVPNYSELFGSPDICECEHCRSVYSAAAYFVDLLRFLWRGVKNHDGKSPLDMLAKRRPDLLYLPLTCENTNTLIPYIDIVNEVMEFYTVNGSLTSFEGYDTDDITAEELRADPQNFNIEAYRELKDEKYPFTLPYHQPLDVIRTYGEHLKTARHIAMEAVQNDFSQATARAIEAESLKISPEEYKILTKEDFAGTADTTQLHVYFGYANAGNLESMAGVREFLSRSGIQYTDLIELVKTKFINPHQEVYDFLQDLFAESTLNASEIYDRLTRIDAGTLIPSADADIMASLNSANITSGDFITWVQANFDKFNAVITLYEPNSRCKLDTTYLRTIGNIYAGVNSSGITNDSWSKIHRFIRLWRKLGWSIHDLDLMLAALDESDITPTTISKLSSAMKLNLYLKRPLNQAATIWGNIDTYGNKSLYKKLFLNKTVLNLDPSFEADKWGDYLTDSTEILSDHVPAILAAFRMSQEDLDAVLGIAAVIDAVTGNPRLLDLAADKLNLQNLSTIYRYTVLSKALKFKVPDFCLLLELVNASPFSTWNNQTQKFDNISPSAALEFYELASSVKKTGFKPVLLQYIFTGELPADSTIGLDSEKAKTTAKTIRDAFAVIEQDHPDEPAVPLTTDILRAKLSLTFQSDTVSQLIAIIENNDVFSTVSVNNLNITIPSQLSAKFSYVNGSGRLTCTGIMTDSEEVTLKGLNANVSYKSDVEELYAAPEEFLSGNFSGVFVTNMTEAFKVLLDHPAQVTASTTEEKLRFVYDDYIPLLKQKLREDAITQHIAALTGLTEEAAKVLTKADADVLISSLAAEGYSAEYFNDTTWTASALERVDSKIDFDWGTASPDAAVTADNFSVRWQSYLTPPASGEYTLLTEVNESDEAFKLYLDDVLILEKATANPLLSWEAVVQLNASQMHKLKVDYSETSNTAGIRLYWKTATTTPEIIPSTSLYPAKVIDEFINTSTIYHRAAKFIDGFELDEIELDHFIAYNSDFGNIDFKTITKDHWIRIYDYISLREVSPQAQASLIDVFKSANTTSPAPDVDSLRELLAQATAWDTTSLEYLVNTHFTLSVSDFKNEISLLRLYDAVYIVTKTGISVDTVTRWGKADTDFDTLHETAQLIKSTVKAKYEEEDWLDIAGKLSDKIRENQKQALISYLLMRPELKSWGVEDADGLFEYFLLDVQMGACMDTSRIVQANAAVQMFVNRCLLNLESNLSTGNEKGVSPEAIDSDRWEWMKFYRVWEANRKVFLYPENWLEPEWRDDRSPFFKDLESELMQNDITDRSVEAAFRNYLTSLNEVANLEVCGMFQENDEQTGKLKLLHIVGRTHNSPYKFYYRTWDEYMKWSAWEKVQVDIRCVEDGENSGVHVIPVVWKNRLFIFWPEFIQKQEEAPGAEGDTAENLAKKNTSELKPTIYWEIRLAWTELIDGKWSPKQLSKEYLYQLQGFVIPDPSKIRFSVEVGYQNTLNIFTFYEFDGGWWESGYFTLADITSKIQAYDIYDYPYENKWEYYLSYMNMRKTSALRLLDDDYLKKSVDHKLLISPDRANYIPSLDNPFFYSDAVRTYFVRPVDITIITNIREPEVYKPFIPEIIDDSYYEMPVHIPEIGPDDYFPQGEYISRPRANFFGLPMETRAMNYTENYSGGSNFMAMSYRMSNPSGVDMNMMTIDEMKYQIDDIHYVDSAFMGVIYKADFYKWKWRYRWDKGLEFHTFYHPYSNRYVTKLNRNGMDGLMSSDTEISGDNGNTFVNKYNPNFTNGLVQKPSDFNERTYFKENVCFDVYGANSIYNWELFFHAPLYIATRLSKNGRYEEAMKWFHYIFDPTTDEMPAAGESETSRYWKVLPFKTTAAESLEDWFLSLSPNSNPNTENAIIGEWRDNPFKPHLVASNRPLAYMKHVVIKYVENLLEWGDYLFRQFTRETVNEALQIYVIANHILGPRPQFVPKRGEIKAESYNTIKNKLDDFSNAIVQLENLFPYSSEIPTSTESTGSNLLGIGESLYFCIPNNEKLLEYWDRATDRLFKIRHCMDITGVERKLALFAPPIDPAALIQAASQGLSLGSILADLSSPPPIYRFTFLIQKANEFCAEVKSLGSALLSVLEKKDSEELSLLRATHEKSMLELMTAIKERQVLDAKSNKENLLKTRATAEFKLEHYNSLLTDESITIPGEPSISSNLTADSSLPADTTINELVPDVDTALVDGEEAGLKLINKEKQEIDDSNTANTWQNIATGAEGLGGALHFIPDFSLAAEPVGVGGVATYGGSNVGAGVSGLAKIPQIIASVYLNQATQASRIATYIRREQEWTLQANLAAKEIIQLDKQITSADIRIQISEKELENHLKQIDNAKEIELFLQDKFTNIELYQWMKEQVFSVYKQSYNMSYDMAKKAEKAYKYEIGNDIVSFIQYGYWDSSYQGLLAAEKLQMALRQLEKSYIEENKRELELRKNLSLAFINPLALQELRQTGRCYVTLPEEVFDIDFQGHYFRRIKSVSLSIPCIAGPLTTISCTLRLLNNSIRINTSMNDEGNYEHMNDEGVFIDDDRFRSSNVPVQSIAVSTGQSDSGLFELNFRDDRYLPFEGAGAISEWKIELTADEDLRQFDYDTISDVIIHLSYTAREDAGLFKEKAVEYIKAYLTNAAELSTQPLMRMFSMRHEFPTEWYRFLNPAVAGADQVLNIIPKREHFPFFTRDRNVDVMKVDILAKASRAGDYNLILTATDQDDAVMTSSQISMPENPTLGNIQKASLYGSTANINVEDINIFSEMSFKFKHSTDTNYHSIGTDPLEIEDIFIVVHYKLSD